MKEQEDKKKKTPWPTKAVMEQIYEENLWGEDPSGFYSGSGSHNADLLLPYIEKVRSFLGSLEQPPVVCDLGCGDFNVGRQLTDKADKYIGVDIVQHLIERNRNSFEADNLEFRCLDIAKDPWPDADCVILRNVLQHLSNPEIKAIAEKLPDHRYIIVTEHLPEGEYIPNKEIISGQGIRLKKKSGVDLLAEPFNLSVSDKQEWLSIPAKKWPGKIVTTLYVV